MWKWGCTFKLFEVTSNQWTTFTKKLENYRKFVHIPTIPILLLHLYFYIFLVWPFNFIEINFFLTMHHVHSHNTINDLPLPHCPFSYDLDSRTKINLPTTIPITMNDTPINIPRSPKAESCNTNIERCIHLESSLVRYLVAKFTTTSKKEEHFVVSWIYLMTIA